jgi:RNA polymerase sigma factor (sigma-70 family)
VNGVSSDAGFEQLFRETRTDLLAYIMRRSPSAADAADVLAQTYLIAWQKLDAIPTGAGARLWLFGVARKLLLEGARRSRSRYALVERVAGELRRANLPHVPVEDERSSGLRAALATLPERDREILMLTAWEDLTPKEIATVVGTSANIVRVRLHRARTRLKRDLTAPRTAIAPVSHSPESPNRPAAVRRPIHGDVGARRAFGREGGQP